MYISSCKWALLVATILTVTTIPIVEAKVENGAAKSVRGVSPERQHLYEAISDSEGNKIWKCLGDPSIVLRYDQINDDYCDCPDGSDEVATNACKFNESNMFYCANEGYFASYIENFKLNDGACDYDKCCDGSDEYLTGACPNKCFQINQQFEQYKSEMTSKISAAKHITNQLVNQAKAVTDKLHSQKDTLVLDIAKTTNMISAVEKKLDVAKNPNLAADYSVFDSLKAITAKVTSNLPGLSKSVSSSNDRIAYLESLLENLKTNKDEVTSKQVLDDYELYLKTKSESDSIPGSILSEIEELLNAATSVVSRSASLDNGIIVPTVSNVVHYYVKGLFELFSGTNVADPSSAVQNEANSQMIDSLEIKLSSLQKELKSKKTSIESIEKDLASDYGPKSILRSVRGKWVNNKIGEYEYKVGLLGSIYQDNNLLGRYSHYGDGKLYYNRGEKCWNGPHRSATVVLSCGTDNQLISVAEPEKCEYVIEMTSPLGCRDISEQELRNTFKIQYDQL